MQRGRRRADRVRGRAGSARTLAPGAPLVRSADAGRGEPARCASGQGDEAVKGYCDNIEKRTVENDDFRHVLYTGHNLQLVLMTLPARLRHRRGSAPRPRPVLPHRGRQRRRRHRRRREPCRGRFRGDRSGRRPPQCAQHRFAAAQALHHLCAARAQGRRGPGDQGRKPKRATTPRSGTAQRPSSAYFSGKPIRSRTT